MTAVGTPIITIGVFDAEISWGQQRPIKTIIPVLWSLSQPVISKSTQISLGMLPSGYPHRQVQKLSKTNTYPFSHLMAVATEKKSESEPTTDRKQADKQALIWTFPDTFDGKCRPMNGLSCHFVLKDGATPVAMRGSRPVAEPLLPQLREELDALEEQTIIEKVTAPTAWVHPIVLVSKKNGRIRSCVDFRNINKVS